jgi:hypothetical protein
MSGTKERSSDSIHGDETVPTPVGNNVRQNVIMLVLRKLGGVPPGFTRARATNLYDNVHRVNIYAKRPGEQYDSIVHSECVRSTIQNPE